jgi:hypothetical protein
VAAATADADSWAAARFQWIEFMRKCCPAYLATLCSLVLRRCARVTFCCFRFDSEELQRNIHDVHLSENVYDLKVSHTRAHNNATAITITIIVIITSSRADASLTQSF